MRQGGAVGSAPTSWTGDPASNPGPGENFSLKLTSHWGLKVIRGNLDLNLNIEMLDYSLFILVWYIIWCAAGCDNPNQKGVTVAALWEQLSSHAE